MTTFTNHPQVLVLLFFFLGGCSRVSPVPLNLNEPHTTTLRSTEGVTIPIDIVSNNISTTTEVSSTRTSRRSDGCRYQGIVYEAGERIATPERCLTCTCKGSVVVCKLRVCPEVPEVPPPGCIVLHKAQDCCAQLICNGPPDNFLRKLSRDQTLPGQQQNSHSFFHGDEEFSSRALVSSQSSGGGGGGCVQDGTVYAEGSAMRSSTLCQHCFCIRGRMTCSEPACLIPLPGCVPKFRSYACCPTNYDCSESRNSSVVSSSSLQAPSLSSTQVPSYLKGCRVGEAWVGEGEPVLPLHLANTSSICQTCFCMGGVVTCSALECAKPIDSCTPVIQDGHCCPDRYECASAATGAAPQTHPTEEALILPEVVTSNDINMGTGRNNNDGITEEVLSFQTESSQDELIPTSTGYYVETTIVPVETSPASGGQVVGWSQVGGFKMMMGGGSRAKTKEGRRDDWAFLSSEEESNKSSYSSDENSSSRLFEDPGSDKSSASSSEEEETNRPEEVTTGSGDNSSSSTTLPTTTVTEDSDVIPLTDIVTLIIHNEEDFHDDPLTTLPPPISTIPLSSTSSTSTSTSSKAPPPPPPPPSPSPSSASASSTQPNLEFIPFGVEDALLLSPPNNSKSLHYDVLHHPPSAAIDEQSLSAPSSRRSQVIPPEGYLSLMRPLKLQDPPVAPITNAPLHPPVPLLVEEPPPVLPHHPHVLSNNNNPGGSLYSHGYYGQFPSTDPLSQEETSLVITQAELNPPNKPSFTTTTTTTTTTATPTINLIDSPSPSRTYSKFSIHDSSFRQPSSNGFLPVERQALPPHPHPPHPLPHILEGAGDSPWRPGPLTVSSPLSSVVVSSNVPKTPSKASKIVMAKPMKKRKGSSSGNVEFHPVVAFPFPLGDTGGGLVGGLKLSGCNIYGKTVRVGSIIHELSSICVQCVCSEMGVQCSELQC